MRGRGRAATSSAPRRRFRPLAVLAYAAFIGILLASYVAPLQEIVASRTEIPALEERLRKTEAHISEQRRLAEELNTTEGIERAARERYGMVRPGEKVYIVPN